MDRFRSATDMGAVRPMEPLVDAFIASIYLDDSRATSRVAIFHPLSRRINVDITLVAPLVAGIFAGLRENAVGSGMNHNNESP